MPFDDLIAANTAYAEGFSLGGLDPSAARGLCVLTCMDSRIEPLAALGLRPGDAKILRNGGARVTDDVLKALIVAVHLLGVDRLIVMAHTECRLGSGTEEELHAALDRSGAPDTSALTFGASPDQRETLRADVERVRSSPFLAGLDSGGFVYDVHSGRLEHVV